MNWPQHTGLSLYELAMNKVSLSFGMAGCKRNLEAGGRSDESPMIELEARPAMNYTLPSPAKVPDGTYTRPGRPMPA